MAADRQQNRRGFLGRLLKWISALVTAALVYPLLRFSGFTVKPKPRYVRVPAPLPASGFHAERDFFLFAGSPAAGGKGSTGSDIPAWAVSRTCTHLGCRVNFLEDKQLIECPCHQSRFSPKGILLHGPAEKNLPTFPVKPQTNKAGSVTSYLVSL
jgi:cytochrome b6-f complex iron-sulfur subunit